MNSAEVLKIARRQAGITQRQLSVMAGVKQPAIARIERGKVVPRVDTLERLLAACGQALAATRRLGAGVDRTVMRELLTLTPGQRARLAVEESRNLAGIRVERVAG